MSLLAKIERKIDAAAQRLEAAERNVQAIVDEKTELEAAHRVLARLLDEDARANGKDASASTGESELTQRALITMILKEADRPMKPAEIAAVALENHGRKIPSGTINGNLHRWKGEKRVIHDSTGWSLTSPVPCNPQPERPDPVERSEDDDLAVL